MLPAIEKQFGILASVAMGRARAWLARLRGVRAGACVRIGSACRFVRPWTVSLGKRSEVEHGVFFKATSDDASLIFGEQVFIGTGTEFDISGQLDRKSTRLNSSH